jgi:probable phosphoglycerate mutase
MDIFLVRHGEAAASWGQHSDPGLSELGVQQAETVAAALGNALPGQTRIISSPLARARETAAPLARLLGREPEINDMFREIPSPVPLAERQVWLRAFMTQQWPEQSAELHAWRRGMLDAVRQFPGPVVVFTHFLVINTIVGAVLDRPGTLSFYPANGSITRLRRDADELQLVALGDQMETLVN